MPILSAADACVKLMKNVQSEFVAHLREVFEDFRPVSARWMFGGYGIYHDDLMFGLVADDVLYLKADKESEQHYLARGLAQFEYIRNGKAMKMSYFMAPEEIFEDYSAATNWATLAYEAALRNKQRSRQKNKPMMRDQ